MKTVDERARRGDSECKGPEVEMHLAYVRGSEDSSLSRLEITHLGVGCGCEGRRTKKAFTVEDRRTVR